MHDAVLIQSATGGCDPLLRLTMGRQMEWSRRQRMDYEPRFYCPSVRHPSWDKIRRLRTALAAGYEYAIWLDADTLVADMDADPREALKPPTQLGMTFIPWIPVPGLPDSRGHWQAGAMYVRSGPDVVEFLAEVWEWGEDHPDVPCWYEQAAINALLLGREIPWLTRLPDRWNSTWCLNACDDPVVMAWHGNHADKLERMREAMEELTCRMKSSGEHSATL